MRLGFRTALLQIALLLPGMALAQLGPAQKLPPPPAAARGAGVLSTTAIAARITPASVSIISLDAAGDTLGQGSGFLVRPNGVIVTNHHVVAGASRAIVILASGESYDRVEALDLDTAADIAVLKIPGYALPTATVTGAVPPVGARVVAIGSPFGLARTVSEGIVSAVRLMDGRQMVQISAAISPGSSGGPVVNDRGEVVAIATSQLTEGQNLNFAVPVRYAMGLVDGARAPRPLAELFAEAPRRPAETPPAARDVAKSIPDPARAPRPTLGGSYHFTNVITRDGGSGPAVTQEGVLLLGERNNVGLWISRFTGGVADTARRDVLTTQRVVTTADGHLGLVFGDEWSYHGYQTEDGFLALCRWALEGGDSLTSVLTANRITIPTERSSGLYQVATRTTWYDPRGKAADGTQGWSGEAAVVIARDSIWLDFYLANSDGGTSGAFLHGPLLSGGRFSLKEETGRTLAGSVTEGVLEAAWVDPREDGGVFRGTLRGTRE